MNTKLGRLMLSMLAALSLGAAACQFLLLPWVKSQLDQRLQARFGTQVVYQKIEWSGLGLKLKKVRLHQGTLKASMDLELKFAWDGLSPKLAAMVLVRPVVNWQRIKAPSPANATVATQVEPAFNPEHWLGKWRQSGISLSIQDGKIEVFDAAGLSLGSLNSLNLQLDATKETMQLSLKELKYRQRIIHERLEGQVLLESKRSTYPIILHAQDPEGEPWQLTGHLTSDFDQIDIRHKRKGLPLHWLPYLNTIAEPEQLLALLKIRIQGLLKAEELGFDVQLVSSNLKIQHALLGDEPVGPLPVSVRMKGLWDLESGALKIGKGLVALSSKRAKAPLRLEFQASKDDVLSNLNESPVRLKVKVAKTSCQTVLDALPENFMPQLADFALEGDFQIAADIQLISAAEPVRLEQSAFDCRLSSVPRIFTAAWLLSPTERGEALAGFPPTPSMKQLKSGPFLARDQIPDDFFRALVAAEDSGFWHHKGVLLPSLIAALKANLKEGRVVYGASTLTMQLAKNLYLGHERVVTRKVQEMFLAWVLEQTLSKAEILEIYANVVEFAPRVLGIRSAANLYFQKPVDQLSIAESLFLASILPSPQRNYAETFCQAKLSRQLETRMQLVAKSLQVLAREAEFIENYQRDLHHMHFNLNPTADSPSCAIAQRNLPVQKARF